MSNKLLQIIEKKVDLFIGPSFVDLGFKISNLIKSMKPDDLGRLPSILEKFNSIVEETINFHSEETIKTIKMVLIESGAEVKHELSDSILKLTNSKINTSKYLDKFPNLLGMIDRHYSRMGIKFDRSKYRLDLSSAKYQGLVKNLVRRNSEKLKTELDILCLSTSQKYSGKVSPKFSMDDANKTVDLKPNFFGIGLNLNYLIPRLKEWWNNRKNT